MFIRRSKTKSGSTQIQVMEKRDRKNRLVKHIGTGINDLEVASLIDQAHDFLDQCRINSGTISFFDNRYTQTEINKFMNQVEVVSTTASPIFDFLLYYFNLLGFSSLKDDQFTDLVLARIIHPTSKAKTLAWLTWKLKRQYSLTSVYRTMLRIYKEGYQNKLEHLVVKFVTKHVEPTISVLFFDVTTLYYEAFDEDDLRKCGFSKDHKANQPQIVIALTVTKDGIPLLMKTFEGNKFEGHTIIPCINEVVVKHNLKDMIVVADSAMISRQNMEALENHGIKYIVGARLGNLSHSLFTTVVTQTPKEDGATKRFALPNQDNRLLIVSYSAKRAAKDRSDHNKRLSQAQSVLSNPSTITSRYKYLRQSHTKQWTIHQDAISKDKKLEGLKGYVTNATNLTNEEVISKYASLWQVERSFRISKSDLKARLIFHTVREKIEAHMTIVFASLAISKYLELNTGKSIASVVERVGRVEEVLLRDTLTGEKFSLHTSIPDQETRLLLKNANLGWVT